MEDLIKSRLSQKNKINNDNFQLHIKKLKSNASGSIKFSTEN